MKKGFFLLIFIFTLSIQFLFAQDVDSQHPILTSKFHLGAGLYIPTQNVKFSVNADAVEGDQTINFNENFNFNNNYVTPQLFFDWRFAKKWILGAGYFNAKYGTTAVLENDIIAGDYTFNSGSSVSLGYRIDLYRIFIGRVFLSDFKYEFGGGLGVHLLDIRPYIEGNIIVDGGDNEFKRISESAATPLPNIALWYIYAPNQKWAFSAKLDWFGLTVGEYSGSLWDVVPSVRYQIIKNLGVSLDYRFFKVKANVNKDSWNGGFDLSFSGPSITVIGNL